MSAIWAHGTSGSCKVSSSDRVQSCRLRARAQVERGQIAAPRMVSLAFVTTESVVNVVYLEDDAGPTEVDAVREAMDQAGYLNVSVKAAYSRRSAGELPWALIVVTAVPLTYFFKGFFTKAGEDAWESVKRWVNQMYDARMSSPRQEGGLVVDGDDHVSIALSRDLPTRAFVLLVTEDLPASPSGLLVYDQKLGCWRDAWDESP